MAAGQPKNWLLPSQTLAALESREIPLAAMLAKDCKRKERRTRAGRARTSPEAAFDAV